MVLASSSSTDPGIETRSGSVLWLIQCVKASAVRFPQDPAEVGVIHPKAMPVILRTEAEIMTVDGRRPPRKRLLRGSKGAKAIHDKAIHDNGDIGQADESASPIAMMSGRSARLAEKLAVNGVYDI